MDDCSKMSDKELLHSLKILARDERRNLPRILARLDEVRRRGIAVERGYHSLYDYCRRGLRWSESETARRIQAARSARDYPVLYPMLWCGRLNLSTISLLAPHLTPDNHRSLIKRALGRTKREVEALIAAIAPRPATPDRIRPLGPAPVAASPADEPGSLFASPPQVGAPTPRPYASSASRPPDISAPLAAAAPAPSRVEFTFTAEEALARDVERARELLRNKHPWCRLEDVFREALTSLLDRLDPDRRAERATPRLAAARDRAAAVPSGTCSSRRIPDRVKAAVWRRDGGKCVFAASDGRRCGSRVFLEYDHVRPWASGGASDDAANVRLLCRAHNLLQARRAFGDAAAAASRGLRRRA